MIDSICVCGAGTMGSGIAQAAAQAGIRTILYDVDGAVLDRAKQTIASSLHTLAERGKIDEHARVSAEQNLSYTGRVEECIADLCIEAIVEKMEAKTALFHQLAGINGDRCIYASNTSSLSIAAIARAVKYPHRVVGMHFFNPATVMKLVEIVLTEETSAGVDEELSTLAKRMGKVPVICRDSPGFIVNRVARPYYIESLRMVEEGLAGSEVIDSLLEAAGFRMGPFRLMDLIGNDVNYAVSCSVYEQLGRPLRLKPSALQEEKVKKGELGRKTGKGFYEYDGRGR